MKFVLSLYFWNEGKYEKVLKHFFPLFLTEKKIHVGPRRATQNFQITSEVE